MIKKITSKLSLFKQIKLSQAAGFTLVELVIYMGLFLMMLVVLTELFSSSLALRLDASATSRVQQDIHFFLTRLRYDAARASSISLPAAAGGSGTTLTLVIDGNSYSYQAVDNDLILASPAGSDQLNSPEIKIENLSFTRLGDSSNHDTIQVRMTVTSSLELSGNRLEQQTIQTTLGLRQP